MDPALLRIQETATLLKVSKWTIYRWIEEGRLDATKIGRGSLRVFQASVSSLIEETQIGHGDAQNDSPKKPAPVRATGQKKNTVGNKRKRVWLFPPLCQTCPGSRRRPPSDSPALRGEEVRVVINNMD